MFFRPLLISLYIISNVNQIYAESDIIIDKLFPPKCSILEESKVLLCPRIMEIDVQIENQKYKKLVNCIVFSEEEEVLAYGENYIYPPMGKVYLTIKIGRAHV